MRTLKIGIVVLVCLILTPLVICYFVSLDWMNWASNSNDWIGFWGNYVGAIIGGIISGLVAIYVMKKTIQADRGIRDKQERIENCLKINEMIFKFCSLMGNCHIQLQEELRIKRNNCENNGVQLHNECIYYSGTIMSMLYACRNDIKYRKVGLMFLQIQQINTLQRILIEDLEKKSIIDLEVKSITDLKVKSMINFKRNSKLVLREVENARQFCLNFLEENVNYMD